MTKLSRSVLKEIVKECIVEIFQESFFHDNPIMMEEKKPRNTRQKRPNVSNSRRVSNNSNRSSLDTVSFGSRQEISENFADMSENSSEMSENFSEISEKLSEKYQNFLDLS